MTWATFSDWLVYFLQTFTIICIISLLFLTYNIITAPFEEDDNHGN